jgi:hypothetical protein
MTDGAPRFFPICVTRSRLAQGAPGPIVDLWPQTIGLPGAERIPGR